MVVIAGVAFTVIVVVDFIVIIIIIIIILWLFVNFNQDIEWKLFSEQELFYFVQFYANYLLCKLFIKRAHYAH